MPMEKSIRQLGEALQALYENPDRLDSERARFYKTPCGTPSEFADTPQPDIYFCIETRKDDLERDWLSSLPSRCFARDIFIERWRLKDFEAYYRIDGDSCEVDDIDKLASETVKKRWVEQGIWDEDWGERPRGVEARWKHEKPLEPVSQRKIMSDGFPMATSIAIARQRETINRESTEEERHREASRPFYQFLYQVSVERRILTEDLNDPGLIPRRSPTAPYLPPPIDANTMAYNIVKERWLEDRLWDIKWGILPGMSWKHEQPFEDFFQDNVFYNNLSPASEPFWVHEEASLRERPHSGYVELLGHIDAWHPKDKSLRALPWKPQDSSSLQTKAAMPAQSVGDDQRSTAGGKPGPYIRSSDEMEPGPTTQLAPLGDDAQHSSRKIDTQPASQHSPPKDAQPCAKQMGAEHTILGTEQSGENKSGLEASPLPPTCKKRRAQGTTGPRKVARTGQRKRAVRQPDPNRMQTRSMIKKLTGCL